MCVDFVIGLLFVHDCLLHDCSFPYMTACRLCLWGIVCIPLLLNHESWSTIPRGFLMLLGSHSQLFAFDQARGLE